jgi:ribonuclease Y
MERLIKDERIQPTRIEEVYHQTKGEIEKIMALEGQKLCHEVGVYNLHPDLVKMLGRFKYRFSYGQNLIIHTLEETQIGIALANEVGADVNIVKLGCLLHDVGKIVAKTEGTHVTKGVELARKYGVPQEAIDCIAQHHEDEPFSSVESMIVYIADAISGSRPGARHEQVEEYITRLVNIEKVADSYPEVEKSFAIQAGREVRVIVRPDKVDDKGIETLAHNIARKLENEIAMRPGQIKVTVIRETRASDQTN